MSGGPVIASAPGKLFLLGEYAVLHGAPALLTAVDRRATATATPARSWSLSAPDLGLNQLALAADGTLPPSLGAAHTAKLAVFDAVRGTVAAAVPRPIPAVHIDVDSTGFSAGGRKLGLGSSAAVAVALTAALLRAAAQDAAPGDVFRLAFDAHRAAQHGAGSGGDVATSVYGGLLSYRKGHTPVQHGWPTGLAVSVVVTGEGARTTDLVGRVARYGERNPAGHDADLGALAALADSAADALSDVDRFLRLADEYHYALARLDEHSEAGILTPAHRGLREIAARHGGVFKTSGAGGGDVGLVFSREEASAAIAGGMAAAGAEVVPLRLAAGGLQ